MHYGADNVVCSVPSPRTYQRWCSRDRAVPVGMRSPLCSVHTRALETALVSPPQRGTRYPVVRCEVDLGFCVQSMRPSPSGHLPGLSGYLCLLQIWGLGVWLSGRALALRLGSPGFSSQHCQSQEHLTQMFFNK